MRYLGKLFDLYPAPEFEWQSDALMGFLTDFVAEGRLVFHAKCFTASYFTQQEETKPNIEWFATTRLPQFLRYLESVLAYGKSGFAIGDRLTYLDVALFHTIEAADF